MEKSVTKNKVIKSLFWKLMERTGVQGVTFLVSIVLARILTPDEYGTISIVMIFIALANVFIQSGLNTALIQKKNSDEIDFSTIFYVSLIIASALYVMLYLCAPIISDFYQKDITLVIRVLAVTLFFGAVNSIQLAFLSKKMDFKKLFFSNLGAVILSGVIGILAAYKGAGVWALVVQQLSNQFFAALIMWFTVKWRPGLLFSAKRLKHLFSYGWKILVTNLINTLFLDLRSLIIGKIYNAEMLAYFDKGKQFSSVIITNINGSIQSVMLPAYSAEQENRIYVKSMMRKSISVSSFVIFPAMIGLAMIAEPLIRIVLTDKWLPCVPFLQIFCFTYMLMPLHTTNLQAIMALGYSNYVLKIETIKKVIEILVLLLSLKFGPYMIALGTLVTSILAFFINAYPNRKLLNYGYMEQLCDIIPALFVSMVMGGIVYFISYISAPEWIVLLVQLTVGFFVFWILSKAFHLKAYSYIRDIIISTFKRKGESK